MTFIVMYCIMWKRKKERKINAFFFDSFVTSFILKEESKIFPVKTQAPKSIYLKNNWLSCFHSLFNSVSLELNLFSFRYFCLFIFRLLFIFYQHVKNIFFIISKDSILLCLSLLKFEKITDKIALKNSEKYLNCIDLSKFLYVIMR